MIELQISIGLQVGNAGRRCRALTRESKSLNGELSFSLPNPLRKICLTADSSTLANLASRI